MTSLSTYAISILVAIALGGITIGVLYRPLFGVIVDLCGTQERARFWSAYLSAILILVPLTFVTYVSTFGATLPDLGAIVQRTTFYALLGLTGALVAIGWGIWRPSNDLLRDKPKWTSSK
jgi:hypothetical protein